jgi:hypothetical protein
LPLLPITLFIYSSFVFGDLSTESSVCWKINVSSPTLEFLAFGMMYFSLAFLKSEIVAIFKNLFFLEDLRCFKEDTLFNNFGIGLIELDQRLI